MKKIFFAFLLGPLLINQTSSSQVETIVRNEASGENASVKTEIISVVNGNESRIESDQPGEITQTVTFSVEKDLEELKEEIQLESLPVKQKIFSLFSQFWRKIGRWFRFKA